MDRLTAATFGEPFDAISAIIAVASFIALWKYQTDIMKVMDVCALLGLVLSFIR